MEQLTKEEWKLLEDLWTLSEKSKTRMVSHLEYSVELASLARHGLIKLKTVNTDYYQTVQVYEQAKTELDLHYEAIKHQLAGAAGTLIKAAIGKAVPLANLLLPTSESKE